MTHVGGRGQGQGRDGGREGGRKKGREKKREGERERGKEARYECPREGFFWSRPMDFFGFPNFACGHGRFYRKGLALKGRDEGDALSLGK